MRTHLRLLFLLLLVMFGLSACNLGIAREQPTPEPLATATPFLVFPTSTPAPPTSTPNPPANTPPPVIVLPPTFCAPRTDLPTYTVVVGDTLANIAQRARTDVATMVAINCLANPNVIRVGQTLWVPNPIVPPTPTQIVPQVIGLVRVAPILRQEGDLSVLTPGGVVTLTWDVPGLTRVPGSTARMQFYITPSGTGNSPIFIGTDGNLGDGGGITWTVPNAISGSLNAEILSSGSAVLARTAQSTRIAADPTLITPTPQIVSFTASGQAFVAGDRVTFSWEVRSAASVTIRITNPDGTSASPYENQPLIGSASYFIPNNQSGTLTLLLVPQPQLPGTPTRQITVTVSLPPQP